MPRLSEDGLIARYFAPLAGPGGLGLGDDAARLTPRPGYDLVLTVDGLVAGVHFLAADPPASVARKALGVNLSDLAAKGAHPVGYLLTLALPDDWTEDWLSDFAAGLGAEGRRTDFVLLGGDTVRAAGPLSLSITAIGELPGGTMVLRSTARPGDLVCVTGTIGDAVLGLRVLTNPGESWSNALSADDRDQLADRYRHPRARLGLAPGLRSHASAAMDVSDGLVGDLSKLMRASGATAQINLDLVPYSPPAARALEVAPDLRDALVTGGDDYEILATVAPESLAGFQAAAAAAGIALTVIGRVLAGVSPPAFLGGGCPIEFPQGAYQHF